MQAIIPPYRVVDLGYHEWRFEQSAELAAATEEFDKIIFGDTPDIIKALRKFLLKFPHHIDALHHLANYLGFEGNDLDAFAFSQTAVATGMRFIPPTFTIGRDRLHTGFTSNRPFLRALHGFMIRQQNIELIEEAIATAKMCLALDPGDRNGARESLVLYYLETGRERTALEFFESPAFKDTFGCCEYLHILALIRTGREEDARKLLLTQLYYSPQVARYILNSKLPPPPNDGFGVTMGSEFEGWMHARDFGHLWRANAGAMKMLRRESRPVAKEGWPRYPKFLKPSDPPKSGR